MNFIYDLLLIYFVSNNSKHNSFYYEIFQLLIGSFFLKRYLISSSDVFDYFVQVVRQFMRCKFNGDLKLFNGLNQKVWKVLLRPHRHLHEMEKNVPLLCINKTEGKRTNSFLKRINSIDYFNCVLQLFFLFDIAVDPSNESGNSKLKKVSLTS